MDRSGRTKKQLLAWSALIATAAAVPSYAEISDNLVEDPGFETSDSNFGGQDATTIVERTTTNPIQGSGSLSVHIGNFGDHVWWTKPFRNGLANHLEVSAHLRSDVASTSNFEFCAGVYYKDDGNLYQECDSIPGTPGDKKTIIKAIDVDPNRPLDRFVIHMRQDGSQPLTFTLDDASAVADILRQPDPENPPTNPVSCTVSPTTVYQPVPYTPPPSRPFVSLAPLTQVSQSSSAYTRFKAIADAGVSGHQPDPFYSTYSIILYRITGNTTYLNDAIARVDAFVNQFEADAQQHIVPKIGGDHFYFLTEYMEPLALTYDAAFSVLTDAQKTKWARLAEDALQNLWKRNPAPQQWFGVTGFPEETAWSVCDAGNNYYFTFITGTMLWALASQDPTWLNELQSEKFHLLIDYYSQMAGGGTREGTGYGTALQNLLRGYLYWKYSTPEDLSAMTSHPLDTIEYWVHATVPTRDRFAPIGDLSRESIPNLYDYQRNLVHEAIALNPGTTEARHGTWWLANISVHEIGARENLWGDMLPLTDTQLQPTALFHKAAGAGALFARSSWSTDASWLAFTAGTYDQSHAHQDQGSFTFFKGDWLAVSSNIWSHSGIHQETLFNNQLRFERSDGVVIPQSYGSTTMDVSNANGSLRASADLSDFYQSNNGSVSSWQRTLVYAGNSLRVTDVCAVGSGVSPIFQLHVPVQPVIQQDGSVKAGTLHITALSGAAAPTIIQMDQGERQPPPNQTLPEFSQGYRLDYRSTAGCTFDFQLQAD